MDADALLPGLTRALARAGAGAPHGLERLSGGANMESWRFVADGAPYVLRRAPSLAMIAARPLDHAAEAAVIRAARGPYTPEVIVELDPADGIGSGFVMHALPGTADPAAILSSAEPGRLLAEISAALADIHRIDPTIPGLPTLDTATAMAELRARFLAHGGDRPVIALALAWLADNLPPPIAPRLVHGDFRMGNLLVDAGWLSGVLDWELAHAGDYHEDLAYGCMTVWRFAQPDRPALGLGSIDDYVLHYEANGGAPVDRERLRFWLIYRTCWWALGCLQMGQMWRDHVDRGVERVVVGRRTAEQELDLLLLLERDAPDAERSRALPPTSSPPPAPRGEPTTGEIAQAIAEWLGSEIKPLVEGRARFDLAVARNALGIIARDDAQRPHATDAPLAADLLAGRATLATPGVLARLRRMTLDKCAADMPKYPALAAARALWEGPA